MRVKKIIVHCSDSDVPGHDNIETIREWHLDRGFNDVGYHCFIRKDGTREQGRHDDVVGAHCAGENSDSLGVCLHGRDPRKFTDAQYKSLAEYCQEKINKYGLTYDDVHGHYEYSEKQCPNFNVPLWAEHYLIPA